MIMDVEVKSTSYELTFMFQGIREGCWNQANNNSVRSNYLWFCDANWYMDFDFKTTHSFLGLYLCKERTGKEVDSAFSFELLSMGDEDVVPKKTSKYIKTELKHIYDSNRSIGRGSNQFISTMELLNSENGFVLDGMVRIKVNLLVKSFQLDPLLTVCKTMTTTLQLSPDFTITTSDQKFVTHKIFLKAHSDVFAAMFESQMIESGRNEIVISDFDANIVRIMVEYVSNAGTLQSNYIALSAFERRELWKLANKYQISRLELNMECKLAYGINETSAAIALLILSDQLQCISLKSAAMSYIVDNMLFTAMSQLSSDLIMEVQEYAKTKYSAPVLK